MKIKTTHYKLDKVNTRINGFKMAVLADLHDTVYGKDNSDLCELINNEKPNIILIAGDLITGLKGREYAPAISLLKKLASKYPVYYGLGNHEVRNYDNTKKYMEEIKKISGVHILDDDCICHEIYNDINGETSKINIYGLTIGREFYSKKINIKMPESYVEDKLGIKKEDGVCNILLAHNPDYFPNYVYWGADLVFSGHLHGGLVRLPIIGGILSPKLCLFPKYDKGRFDSEGTTMIVSAGLGTHTVPRIFNPPELLVVEF